MGSIAEAEGEKGEGAKLPGDESVFSFCVCCNCEYHIAIGQERHKSLAN